MPWDNLNGFALPWAHQGSDSCSQPCSVHLRQPPQALAFQVETYVALHIKHKTSQRPIEQSRPVKNLPPLKWCTPSCTSWTEPGVYQCEQHNSLTLIVRFPDYLILKRLAKLRSILQPVLGSCLDRSGYNSWSLPWAGMTTSICFFRFGSDTSRLRGWAEMPEPSLTRNSPAFTWQVSLTPWGQFDWFHPALGSSGKRLQLPTSRAHRLPKAAPAGTRLQSGNRPFLSTLSTKPASAPLNSQDL